ncbi:AI-2E family transporter [Mobilicoccus caccae]|uniref:AI-2E family transporter n=1 Tax=Mobilicoccus caccae TaxID=1859295 RepID=A0ABQ6IXU4_9MICO|nr:AI-2E family transporter [Mobilicoccus caccae]
MRRRVARLRMPDPSALLDNVRRRIPEGPVVPPSPREVPQLPPQLPAEPLVRTRWPHFLTVSVGLAAFVVGMAGVRAASEVAAPIFLALNLVIASYPMHGWLRRRGLPGPLAAVFTGLVVIAVLIGFFALLGWSIAALVLEMPRYIPKVERLYLDMLAMLETRGITEQALVDSIQDTVSTQWQNFAQQGLTLLQGVLSNLTGVLSLLLVLVTVLFFLTMDTIGVGRRFDLIRQSNPHVSAVLRDFARGVRRYWIVTTVFGLIVAVLDTWVLMYLGVPLALVWGVFSFLTNYIPNIGFVIGLIPPALLGLLEKGPKTAVAVIVAYCVLNFVIQSLIQPKVAGDAVGVTPTVSIVSLLFWTWVLGPLGALLALPATLLVKAILIDGDRQAGWVSYLIASSPENQRVPGTRVASRTSPTSDSSTSSSATTPPPETPST